MTQTFVDVPATQTLKLSRPDLLDRDTTSRTMNSGNILPDVDDTNYAEMIGMVVFKTDELVNRQLTEYDDGTDIATWLPMVSGPISSTDGNIAVFDGLTGGKIKDSGKAIPTGAIVGSTDTQVLTNKTLTNLTASLAIAEGGTGASTKTSAFDNLSPTNTKGDLISHAGAYNGRVDIGSDTQLLTADTASALGMKWAAPDGGGAGGLTLQVETVDFTAEKDKLHYITATGAINVKLPSSFSVGDRFGVLTGASDNVSIYTNEAVATQKILGKAAIESAASSSSSIKCGSITEKMIYAELSKISATEFIAYVNYVDSVV